MRFVCFDGYVDRWVNRWGGWVGGVVPGMVDVVCYSLLEQNKLRNALFTSDTHREHERRGGRGRSTILIK
jgi:hypothetical protein